MLRGGNILGTDEALPPLVSNCQGSNWCASQSTRASHHHHPCVLLGINPVTLSNSPPVKVFAARDWPVIGGVITWRQFAIFNIPQMKDNPENRGKDDTFLKRGVGGNNCSAFSSSRWIAVHTIWTNWSRSKSLVTGRASQRFEKHLVECFQVHHCLFMLQIFYEHFPWEGTITNPIHCFRGRILRKGARDSQLREHVEDRKCKNLNPMQRQELWVRDTELQSCPYP